MRSCQDKRFVTVHTAGRSQPFLTRVATLSRRREVAAANFWG